MCLTIPAKVIRLKKNKAIICENGNFKTIETFLVPDLKAGNWILHINNTALKKIPSNEAEEILKLLEKSYKNIDSSKLSKKFKNIIQKSKFEDLNKNEVIYLLQTKGEEKKALFLEAKLVRKEYIKDFICIHGIIEFSNFCKNDCFYCGLRKENKKLKRYRMSVQEIVKVAEKAVKEKGYKLLILQSGEDYYYTNEMLTEIIKKIKEKCQVFIFISVGERDYDCYKKLKEAGASGILLRFETSNPKLFKKIHPQGKSLKNRFKHLRFMKDLKYFIATGSIIGLPGQKIKDLAEDIFTIKKWSNMISIGPYVPTTNTPLIKIENKKSSLKTYTSKEKADLSLKMIAILRLLTKNTKIPVTTALETLAGENVRKKALQVGANSLMFNLTPKKYRHLYKIYDNKFFQQETIWQKYGLFKQEESYKMLEEKIAEEIKKNEQS